MIKNNNNPKRWVLDHILVAFLCVSVSVSFTLLGEKQVYEHLYNDALERQLQSINMREERLRKEIAPMLKDENSTLGVDQVQKLVDEALFELGRQREDIKSSFKP